MQVPAPGKHFYREEKEAQRVQSKNSLCLFMGWALDRKEGESVFFLILCYAPRSWEHSILVSQFRLTEVSVYCGSVGKESTCNTGDLSLIPVLGGSPRKGKGYPLQYSGLENSLDCIVHGVTMSQTQLNDFHFHFCLLIFIIAFPYYSFSVCKVSSDISCFILDINLCLLLLLSRNKTRSLLVLLEVCQFQNFFRELALLLFYFVLFFYFIILVLPLLSHSLCGFWVSFVLFLGS